MQTDDLGPFIRLLASDKDGEVVAAARALERKLKARGGDLHSLAELVEGNAGSSRQSTAGMFSQSEVNDAVCRAILIARKDWDRSMRAHIEEKAARMARDLHRAWMADATKQKEADERRKARNTWNGAAQSTRNSSAWGDGW